MSVIIDWVFISQFAVKYKHMFFQYINKYNYEICNHIFVLFV